MTTTRMLSQFRVGSILLALAGVLFVAGGMARPVSVATVNLSRVLEGLQQRADAEVGLRALRDEIDAEKSRREKELEDLRTQLQSTTDPAAAIRLDEEIALKRLNYQAWQQFVMNKVDIEKALLMQDLYRSIRSAIAEMAEADGYDLVLVDDSQGPLDWSNEAPASREAQTLQKIAGRSVLYAAPAIDVTADLVARMNNKYRAGQP